MTLECMVEEGRQLSALQEIAALVPDERENLYWCDNRIGLGFRPASLDATGRPQISWLLREPETRQATGYIEVHDRGRVGLIAHLFVAPMYRHQGVAQALWRLAMAYIFQHCEHAMAACHVDNIASRTLQIKNGFQSKGPVEGRPDLETLWLDKASYQAAREREIAAMLANLC